MLVASMTLSILLIHACWSYRGLHRSHLLKISAFGHHRGGVDSIVRHGIDYYNFFIMRKEMKRYGAVDMQLSGRIHSQERSNCVVPGNANLAESKETNFTASSSRTSNSRRFSPDSSVSLGSRYKLYKEDLSFDLNTFITGLNLRSRDDDFELTYNEREDLYILLVSYINENLSPSNFMRILSSLTRLKQLTRSWECARELALMCKLMPLGGHNETFSAEDVSLIYTSFARMHARYDNTLGERNDFVQLTAIYITQMKYRSVGDIIWALGAMNASWKRLPPDLRHSVTTAMFNHTTSFSSYTLSSVLWAVSKMGMKWSYFHSDLRELVLLRLQALAWEMSPQQSSKVIWALGNLGASYDELSGGMLISLLENVNRIKKSRKGNAVPASQSLVGIAKTGANWEILDVSMRNNIWEQVERVIKSDNDRGIANAFWALGSLGSSSSKHTKVLREALFQACTRVGYCCSSWGFCNMIWGFAKMGYVWKDFPLTLKKSIIKNVGRMESEMNAIDVSIITWSLGSLMMPLNSSPCANNLGTGREEIESEILRPLLKVIIRTLPAMNSQEVSSVIWGLSGTGIAWDSLPRALRWSINIALRRISESMSVQDVANCAYSLTLLSFDTEDSMDPAFRGAHNVLMNKLRAMSKFPVSSKVESEQLRIFAHFFKTFDIGAKLDFFKETSVPQIFLESEWLKDSSFDLKVRSSGLQCRVIEGLKSAFDALERSNDFDMQDIYINTEVSSFEGILPVDAAIFVQSKWNLNQKDVLAILEIDGPQHYRDDGALRRVDQLKEFMYLKRHPRAIFCRVRWDEANKIGASAIGNSLAIQILQTAEIYRSPFSAANKILGTIVTDAKKAFKWGLRNDGE